MGATASATHAMKPGQFVETVLGRLFVQESGKGEGTIVLWPSIFTDHHIYDRLADQLAHSHRVLAVDGPGHGQSPGRPQEFSMSDCASSIVRILDAFGIEKAIIGGTSWGGLAAAQVALDHPERVKAVILMNTPMRLDGDRPVLSSRSIAFGARWILRHRTFRDGIARSFFKQSSLQQDPTFAAGFHAMLANANPRHLSAAVRSVILRGKPLIDRLEQIKVPLLIIAGTDDAMYPLATQAEAAIRAPEGILEPVAGRHISVVDAPDDVSRVMARFLAEVASQ